VFFRCGTVRGETALSRVLISLDAEKRATHKHAEFTYRRGDAETRYLIERIEPDRSHWW
jgi:hypothetical protein